METQLKIYTLWTVRSHNPINQAQQIEIFTYTIFRVKMQCIEMKGVRASDTNQVRGREVKGESKTLG